MVNTASSLNQGVQFQQITAKYHGGRKNTRRSRMRGGSMFTPYSDYPSAMDQTLPTEIRELARIAPLDAKFAELPAIERAAGVPQTGGRKSRKNRKNRRQRGGESPINAPTMLLSSPAEEAAARLNPQWYDENTVVPAFRGPLPVPGSQQPTTGGKRKHKTKRARHVINQIKMSRHNKNNRNRNRSRSRNSTSSNKERVRLLAEELKGAKNNGERNHNSTFPKMGGSMRR